MPAERVLDSCAVTPASAPAHRTRLPCPVPPPSLESQLDLALDAVAQAATVCRHVQARLDDYRSITKDDRSPVTVADFASQAIVAAILRETLGEVRLVAEESSAFLRDPAHAAHLAATRDALRDSAVWPDASERALLDAIDLGSAEPEYESSQGFWTLDPIDGTKGFLRSEQYAVCLALIIKGEVRLGVLACPNLPPGESGQTSRLAREGSTYWAIQGAGAMMLYDADHAQIELDIAHPGLSADQPARIAESVEASHTRQDKSAALVATAWPAGVAEPIRIDSQCKYALVARGDADVYLRLPAKPGYVEKIWDHAAGSLIVREAGCIVTDLLGKPLDFSRGRGLVENTGIVGAPPDLHPRLIEAAKAARQP